MTYKLVQDKNGRNLWYKDGKRIAEAKVPPNVKKSHSAGGKSPARVSETQAAKSPARKTQAAAKKSSPSNAGLKDLQKNYKNMNKKEILAAMESSLTLELLRQLVTCIPRSVEWVEDINFATSIKADAETKDPYGVCGRSVPKCMGAYCSKKTKQWKCS